MRRDLGKLEDQDLDLLVLGGGILGACVAWDATLRGLRVALVEKDDFAAGASSNSLKILHGGLRDLQSFDLGRCRRNILERSSWFRIAPHLVDPLAVIIPCFRHGLLRKSILRPALLLNDAFGWDRNAGLHADRRIPRSGSLDRDGVVELVPELGAFDITGGVMFHDGLMWSAERIVLEVVHAAAEAGALVVNHATVEGPARPEEPAGAWLLRDALTGTEVHVRPLAVVNATGASGPAVAKSLGYSSDSLGTFALALNLLVPSRGHRAAFALPGERRESKGVLSLSTRQLFVVPWKDRLMIGTGHYPLPPRADPAQVAATRSREFLELVNRSWPGDPFSEDEVALVHWGVLPSPDLDGGGAPRPLKGPRIVEGRRGDGAGPLFLSAMTAKFTEGRLTAERVVDRVLEGLGKSPVECKTHSTPLPGAPAGPVGDLQARALAADSNGLPARTVRHLVRSYGSRYGEVLAYRDRLRDWNAPVADGEVTILAQWAYAVDREMACTAEDLVRRRTDLGSRGLASPGVLERARHFLADGSAGKD